MPKPQIAIALLVHRYVHPSLALLLRDVFVGANQLMGTDVYRVDLVGVKKEVIRFGPVSIAVKSPRGQYDHLLVPPVDPSALHANWDREIRLIHRLHSKKTRVASACLGVFLLAESGLLNGRAATTHWAWLDYAQEHFPDVHWNLKNMICDESGVITAGGYLASIDLALHLIARDQGKKVAHQLGRALLAESIRERQSIYATHLITDQETSSRFHQVIAWIDRNLRTDITVSRMAEISNMSLRNFQRAFTQAHGISPKKYLQLRRIEKAKLLLSETRGSIDEVMGQVGVSDVSSFRKLFQREVGLTPAEFRKRIQGQ